MIYNTILETIGRTPVVRLNRMGADLECELYGKCQFFNPGSCSGGVLWAALQVAPLLPKGARCLALFPDGIRNYMTKFIGGTWMQQQNFM